MQEEATTPFIIEIKRTLNDMHKWWRLADNTKHVFVFNFDMNMNVDTLLGMEICFKPH